ncbi:phospholipase A2, minor isoenzyme-like [Sparus aurata]|uniref:phospholipase A2, minor isoenzyme-like n=1 Tax=Sparus aurata TaxID=8175 RepID=UPI0011C1505E|nr:phospholipase A2, minor isoenzyme-like [Sparus aurata]
MNLSGPLLLLLLTAACTVSGQQESRSLWQFRNMIKCVQPDVLFALKYDNYGCYCGYGGQGTPVDELDQCCKVHDDCYEAQMNDPECKSFWPHLKPYFIYYRYTCTEHQPTCSASNNKCQAAACECDRAAALCFARAKYNPEHKFLNQKRCKKMS